MTRKTPPPSANDIDPSRSAANAKRTLSRFTLGSASKKTTARTYVDPAKDMKAQQAESIIRQLPALAPDGPGLRIVSSVANPLGMGVDGEIDLVKLLNALETSKSGTQFYTSQTSVAERMEVQRRIDTFFASLGASDNA